MNVVENCQSAVKSIANVSVKTTEVITDATLQLILEEFNLMEIFET